MAPRLTHTVRTTLLALVLTACTTTPSPDSVSSSEAIVPRDNSDITRVSKIIDGNTITAQQADTTLHIRLINTQAPALEADNPDATCLAQEAADQLAALLPVGTPITLTYDPNLPGPQPGETTPDNPVYAGVTLTGGKLINAEITRTGHVVATSTNSTLYLTDVEQAQAEAEQNQVGLYSRTHDCTLPAQLTSAISNLNDATGIDLKEPLETADSLPQKLADYTTSTDHPHLTTIASSQTVATLTETLNRTATSKRGAYTFAQELEEEKKAQEKDNPTPTSSPQPDQQDSHTPDASDTPDAPAVPHPTKETLPQPSETTP